MKLLEEMDVERILSTELISLKLQIEEVDNLDIWDKYKLWSDYMINNVYNNRLRFNNKLDTCLRSNKSLEEFMSKDNISIQDMGENWKENGFGGRYWIRQYGIYDWYYKFKHLIK